MVLTSRPRPLTSAMPASRAISELGTRSVTRGQRNSTARQTTPTRHACPFTVEKLPARAASFSVVSTVAVPGGYVRPKKSFSWPMVSVTAMPAVNPVVIVKGTKRMRAPNLNRPMKMSMMPAIMVAAMSPSMPSVATMPATMVAKAAVGPEICTRLPPRNAMRNPATMAV